MSTTITSKLGQARKALAAMAAAAAVAIAAGLISGDAVAWVTGGIAALTALVVTYLAPANDGTAAAKPSLDTDTS